ncbi:MAG: LamB/YcsF family protein [Calditerrivibrio sp.]|nr:LamB/YcsF family protein [Calditerrivibrio sp.]
MYISLNADFGESFGIYKLGNDDELIKYVDLVNIACGFHAGDPLVMDSSVEMAKRYGVKVGAHPGYPDLVGFGRRKILASPKEVESDVIYQIASLNGFCKKYGIEMYHVKPHGALYNYASVNYDVAFAIAKAVKYFDGRLLLMGLAGSELIRAAKDIGLNYLSEGFADRHYDRNGKLVDRSVDGSVIHDIDTIKRRVESMILYRKIESIDGEEIDISLDSICVHGDNVNAINIAKSLKELLKKQYKN